MIRVDQNGKDYHSTPARHFDSRFYFLFPKRGPPKEFGNASEHLFNMAIVTTSYDFTLKLLLGRF